MVAFQAVDPGSTPGRRIVFFNMIFPYELSILSEKNKTKENKTKRITVLSFSFGQLELIISTVPKSKLFIPFCHKMLAVTILYFS